MKTWVALVDRSSEQGAPSHGDKLFRSITTGPDPRLAVRSGLADLLRLPRTGARQGRLALAGIPDCYLDRLRGGSLRSIITG